MRNDGDTAMNMLRQVDNGEDQTIVCVDCGTAFVWTVGEQRFFLDHGFQTPKRCRPCRRGCRAGLHRAGREAMRERVATRKERL